MDAQAIAQILCKYCAQPTDQGREPVPFGSALWVAAGGRGDTYPLMAAARMEAEDRTIRLP